MGEFSLLWAVFIVLITALVYQCIKPLIISPKNKLIWLIAIVSVCVYSGVGIAYSTISKAYLIEYFIYIVVLGGSFAAFALMRISLEEGRIYLLFNFGEELTDSDDTQFWESDFTAWVFKAMLAIYFFFRIACLVYPVNKLFSLSLTYDAANNLKNISGENTTIFTSAANYIRPFAYIGMAYAFKKVRYVGAALFADLLIILMYSGYVSRNYIICVLFIVLMLFYNNDLNDLFMTLSQKRQRIALAIGILSPIVLYMMIYLMTIRTVSSREWTILSFFSSEIDYPKHYSSIDQMAGTLMTGKDMLLHILDSFVPVIPTPGYVANLNVIFSESISGITMDIPWFSVILPGILGEAKLIFGSGYFWVHAIIIAFMMSKIVAIVGNNKRTSILFYHYLTCVMKAARAGYAELSSTVMFNYIVFFVFIYTLKLLYANLQKYRTIE